VRFLSRLLLFVIFVAAVVLALFNRDEVMLDLGGSREAVPLYLLMIGALVLGVIIGWLIGWTGAAPHRRRAREEGRRATMLQDRVSALETARAPSPSPSDALPSPRIPAHMDDE
jgi:uncharacterized integral membrane protein